MCMDMYGGVCEYTYMCTLCVILCNIQCNLN